MCWSSKPGGTRGDSEGPCGGGASSTHDSWQLCVNIAQAIPIIVGRLRAKIVHFFDKSVKIGTGVV